MFHPLYTCCGIIFWNIIVAFFYPAQIHSTFVGFKNFSMYKT